MKRQYKRGYLQLYLQYYGKYTTGQVLGMTNKDLLREFKRISGKSKLNLPKLNLKSIKSLI